MSAVIEPLRNVDGTIKTNVQIVRDVHKILKRMRDGIPGQSTEAHKKEQKEFYRIINNEPQIMTWIENIAKIEDDRAAQYAIEETLLPIDMPAVSQKISKKDRIRS